MSLRTAADLVRALNAESLLTAAQADVLARELLPRFSDPRALARELVGREWVTPYQINQLFLGRGRELVLGPYLLLQRLGEGGMGQVFKAWHRKMDRAVALKVMRQDKLGNAEAVRRFFREVQAAAALDHPNIVRAYDADEVGGTYFFAMEFVEGSDLGRLVRQKGPLKIGKACEYMRQAALGLQHAHEKGLVHRDIKPSNIIVRTSGSHSEASPLVKILDMGLARVCGALRGEESGEPLTQLHAILGTPDFIAPEQAQSARDVDIRSDLYSLGCTFYYILTGEVPFPAAGPMEKLLKHYLEEPPRVEKLRPEVPAGICGVVRKLMAKSPEARYQTPAELAQVLRSMVAARAPASIPMAIPVGPARPPDSEPTAAEPPTDETLPDVRLEFETSESLDQIIKAVNTARRRPARRTWLTFAVVGAAAGLVLALLALIVRYSLH